MSLVLKGLDGQSWFVVSCGEGSKGAGVYDWQVLELKFPVVLGWRRCLLVRRSRSDGELRVYVCFAPKETSVLEFVEVAGVRWTVECCFAGSKSEVGFDEYEVQSYSGWYKHITFVCVFGVCFVYVFFLLFVGCENVCAA